MKIALLITGQLRTYKLCGNVLINTLINKYDTDVFLAIDMDNSRLNIGKNIGVMASNDEVNDVINMFKPIDY